jgi:hypothetical protein
MTRQSFSEICKRSNSFGSSTTHDQPTPTHQPQTQKHNPPLTNNNNHDGDDINKNDINNDNNKNNKNHNHTNTCVASAMGCRLRTLASKALNTFRPWPVAKRAAEKKKFVGCVSGFDHVRRLGGPNRCLEFYPLNVHMLSACPVPW